MLTNIGRATAAVLALACSQPIDETVDASVELEVNDFVASPACTHPPVDEEGMAPRHRTGSFVAATEDGCALTAYQRFPILEFEEYLEELPANTSEIEFDAVEVIVDQVTITIGDRTEFPVGGSLSMGALVFPDRSLDLVEPPNQGIVGATDAVDGRAGSDPLSLTGFFPVVQSDPVPLTDANANAAMALQDAMVDPAALADRFDEAWSSGSDAIYFAFASRLTADVADLPSSPGDVSVNVELNVSWTGTARSGGLTGIRTE